MRVFFDAHDLTICAVYFQRQYAASGTNPITLLIWDYIDAALRHTPATSLLYIGRTFNARLGINKITRNLWGAIRWGHASPRWKILKEDS